MTKEAATVRDRIKSLRRVRAGDLIPHPKNWRRHPAGQAAAMRAALTEIGFADALLVRETKKGLQIIDGHLRAELNPDQKVPVLVLDVTAKEADKLLAPFDRMRARAETGAPPRGERRLLRRRRTAGAAGLETLRSCGGAGCREPIP